MDIDEEEEILFINTSLSREEQMALAGAARTARLSAEREEHDQVFGERERARELSLWDYDEDPEGEERQQQERQQIRLADQALTTGRQLMSLTIVLSRLGVITTRYVFCFGI